MTETTQATPEIAWDSITPAFKPRLKDKPLPPRPPEGAIAQAQRSYDGYTDPETGIEMHALSHRFPTVELAAQAADELKRAGAYTNPPSSVTVRTDEADGRVITWQAGKKRGRAVDPAPET